MRTKMNTAHFKKLDEGFVCEFCGKKVPPLNYSSRDHCPHCLFSKHVDIFPGDRQNTCHGLLKPIGVEQNSDGFTIIYRCEKCGKEHKNKSATDDNFNLILALSNFSYEKLVEKLKK